MNGLNVLKRKAKSIIVVFLCVSMIFGEVVLFPMSSKAETISQGAPLLDISVGEEVIIEDGGTSIRQFPFVHGFGDDIVVSFSEFTDTAWGIHEKNGLRISHDGGTTWPTYIEDTDVYFTGAIKLDSETLFGVNYTSYWIDERHGTVEYATSTDNGETWEKHTGTVEFPQDMKTTNTGWASFQFHRGMMQMPDGSIQGLMYGAYAGDSDYRVIWVKSTDGGENWSVVSTVAVPTGTGPSVYCEPTVARCSDDSLLCVMRIGNAPLYQCRSTDNGLTWSKPEQIPGVTDTDAYSVDANLYMMSNGVLVLSYGRPHCKMLFSADGTGKDWKNFTLTYTETTSGYTGVCEVAPGKLLLVGDKGADWQNPENFAIWGKYIDVRKTSVALESDVDAGYVDINGNTYTAVPYDGNEFLGWYNQEGELVSTNLTETFEDGNGVFTAKFKNNSIFESPGFEYSELGAVYTNDPANAVYPNWYASADWAKVDIVTSKAYNSSRSMKFFTRYRTDTYTDITGLRPNTNYTVSYHWMMPGGYADDSANCFYGMIASSTQYGTTGEAYKNNIGNNYGSYYPEAGVWNKATFSFNTGDLTTVRLFLEYSAGAAFPDLYIDNFTVAKEPQSLSVSVESGTDAGYITNEGNTYTAVPYDGNKFLGWYSDDALVSKSLTETFSSTDGAIIAKFKNNSVIESPGFELSELGDTVYHEHSTVNSGWHIGADWGSAKIVNSVAHSGSKSLDLFSRFQQDVYTNISGLKPHTTYTVSYYWMMPEAYTTANNNCYSGMIASSTECDAIGAAYQNTIGNSYGAYYPEAGMWHKDTFEFNTGDLTTVRLFVEYTSANAHLYIDDFTIFKNPEPLSVGIESGTDAGYITNNGDIYTAVPYDGNTFLGWYDAEGEIISTELTENFAYTDGAVTAKFQNKSIFESPGFELSELGNVRYSEHSAVNEGWHISADWSSANIIDSLAHSGSKSLDLFSRFQQDVYTNISGLKPHTTYTVSYYWMMPEAYSATNLNSHYGMVVASTEYDTIGAAYQNNIGSNYGDYRPEVGGTWYKDTFEFNTGDLTTVRLFVEYASTNSHIYIDEFTVFESESSLITGKTLVEGRAITQSVVTVSGNAATLDYTASGLEFTLNCEGAVKANFNTEIYNTNWDLRLALYIDGVRQNDIVLNQATTEVVLATGLEKGKHTFKIERMTESQIGKIHLNYIRTYGDIKNPPSEKDLFIDFYGDNITAGWGTTAYSGSPTNVYQYMDGTITYAALTADKLGANFNAFGYSGWGVAVSGEADGTGTNNMATIYPEIPKNLNADYVVINLGTNDASKYVSAGLTEQQVKDAYVAYAKTIRADYGADTPIIFVYGMMTDAANEFISYTVDTLKAEGDDEIYSVKLPKGTNGGDGHPNAAEHAAASSVLAAFIEDISVTLAGDINDDDLTNLKDLVTLAQSVAGWKDITVNEKVVDVNNDGNVDLSDVTVLAKYLAGWKDIAINGTIYNNYVPVTHTLKEIESNLKLNSRAAFDGDVLRMEWSNSGFTVKGQFEGDFVLNDVVTTNEVLLYAVLDDDYDNPVQARTTGGDVTVLKDINAGLHTIQILKATEASSTQMTVGGITYNGAIFNTPAEKELKIQVIGDSITSASGLYTTDVEPDALLRNDITKGYAYKVAKHYGAELSVVSVSGGTVCTNTPSMQDYYQQAFFSKDNAYDFSTETKPDLVIVALGTNDTPTYNTDNVPNDNVGVLKQGIKDMLTLVRQKNPNAKILWAYGMMATNISSVYKEAVEEWNATDGNAYYTMINRNDCNGDGGHPTPNGHTLNTEEYITFIDNNIWVD